MSDIKKLNNDDVLYFDDLKLYLEKNISKLNNNEINIIKEDIRNIINNLSKDRDSIMQEIENQDNRIKYHVRYINKTKH